MKNICKALAIGMVGMLTVESVAAANLLSGPRGQGRIRRKHDELRLDGNLPSPRAA
jgi:hypothetical protein